MPSDLVRDSPSSDRLDANQFSEKSAAALQSLLLSGNYSNAMSLPMPGRSSVLAELILYAGFLKGSMNCWDESRFHDSCRSSLTRRYGKALAVLYDLFWLHKTVSEILVAPIVGADILNTLVDSGILRKEDDGFYATVRCFSFQGRLFLFDFDRARPDFVFFGTDSYLMPRFISSLFSGRRFGKSLDLCTGSGVQGLFMSSQSEEQICADINARAVSFARANALLNKIQNVKAVQSDMFSNLVGPFDCVTANTPYRPMPQDSGVKDLPLRGGDLGIEFTLQMVGELPSRLTDKGVAILYTSDPVVSGQRVLLDEVKRVLADHPTIRATEYLLFRSYTDEPYLLDHFQRHKMDGYDDCLLVLEKGAAPAFERKVWRPSFYWRTYIKAELQRRRLAKSPS
jgi:methylase of polypeptide subunit release factors